MLENEHFNPIKNIPLVFQSRVCICDSPTIDDRVKPRHLVWCGLCHKPARWQLRICSVCHELYIRDFVNPKDCKYFRHQRCWDCLNNADSLCPDGCEYHTITDDIRPIGLNPIKMTEEEKEDLLKEFGFEF